MTHIKHDLTPDETAIQLAKEIHGREIEFVQRVLKGEIRKRQMPTKGEQRQHIARSQGMLMGLSAILYGDWTHVDDAMEFVKTRPWEAQ